MATLPSGQIPGHEFRPAARARSMDCGEGQSAYRESRDQPHLASTFREAAGSHGIQLRKSGKAPTHPELLDWLAVEFMDRNWDMKAMHRLMVTSNAYKTAVLGLERRVSPS